MKYNSKSEMKVLQKVASDTGLSEAEVFIAYNSEVSAIVEELAKPKYKELILTRLGTFKFRHSRIERLLNKYLRKLNSPYKHSDLGKLIAHAVDLNYYFKKLFNAKKIYTKNNRVSLVNNADEILSNYSNIT